MNPDDVFDLLDFKRKVFDAYGRIRMNKNPGDAWKEWVSFREDLFRTHPQSPIPSADRGLVALEYFPYDPAARALAELTPAPADHYDIETSGEPGGTFGFTRFASVSFEYAGAMSSLDVYWLEDYGGGLFLPFRDATSGRETYGAGRYLLDTVKGADLGSENSRLVLDFNFSYQPSCAYDPRWVCPLAPPSNRIPVAIRAGEKISRSL